MSVSRFSAILLLTVPVVSVAQTKLNSTAELAHSDSIEIYSLSTDISSETRDWEYTLGLSTKHLTLDYQINAPIDPFGSDSSLNFSSNQASLKIEKTFTDQSLYVSGSYYEGFRSPGEVWLNEYYRQQYEGVPLPGVSYQHPEVNGRSISIGYSRTVFDSSSKLSFDFGLIRDNVAPGYEIEDLGTSFELIRGETQLATWIASITYENIPTENIRLRNRLSVSRTTTRETRYSLSSELIYALSKKWTSRTKLSCAIEDPSFTSWSVQQLLIRSLSPKLYLALGLRYYTDSGQIESANLVSAAAPGLESRSLSLGIHGTNDSKTFTWSMTAGPYQTRYEATGIGTERFIYLYSDRDWTFAQVSGSFQF